MISDEALQKAGVSLSEDPAGAYAAADIVLKLHPPTLEEAAQLREGSLLVSHIWPFANQALCRKLMERRVAVFVMDQIPRTTKAQYMDAVSSQMNIAGYKAVILAAERLPKVVPLMMTAAGTINPAREVCELPCPSDRFESTTPCSAAVARAGCPYIGRAPPFLCRAW